MRTRVLAALAVLALAVLGTAWFLATFERVPVKMRVGPSGEARINPFLAAQRFAGRMGARSRALRSLPELDALAAPGFLVLPRARQALGRERLLRILAWVEGSGGHLLAEAELPGVDDPLLDALGIERRAAKEAPQPLAIALPEGGELRVTFPDTLALPAERVRFLSRGKGRVIVVSSLDFARNDAIGEHDNAAFLWHWLERSPERELAVVLRPERLSLWRLLLQHATPAVAAATALLLAWLWRIAPRFGPLALDAPPARRRLLDHLRASGRYYWSSGLRSRLAAAARDAALHRLARVQPEFAEGSASEQARRLSSIIGIRPEEARRFIAGGGAMARAADLIRLASHARRVHALLERGPAIEQNREKGQP